jgi:acyl carrier protein phosphodiesterase
MNHLAHFLLAPDDDEARAGTLIADFVRGADLSMFAPRVEHGIRLHRHIDALVDGAPEVSGLKALSDPPLRRYAGIVLDVLFDHVLIRCWKNHASVGRREFSAAVYASLERHEALMPERSRLFSMRLREHDMLDSCTSLKGCERTLEAISRRLARPVQLAHALPAFTPHLARLEAALPILLDRLRAPPAARRT